MTARSRSRVLTLGRTLIIRVAGWGAFLAAWEGVVAIFGIRRYLLPPPSAVFALIGEELPLFVRHTRVTSTEAILGLLLATLIGVAVAILMVYSPRSRAVVMPTMVAFNAVPKVAFAPLLIVWLGLGPESKIATAFLLSVFPIMVNTTTGMREIEPELIGLVRLSRASRRQELLKIRLPSALPALFDGLRIALPLAIVGAIVAEFVASSAGLGFLIVTATIRSNTVLVFAAIVMTVVFSTVLYGLLEAAERRLLRWRPSNR